MVTGVQTCALPICWADEDGNPVINENRWKLWRMYSAGLPAMQFRTCRDAFYRTQMESLENNNPDRFRIRFREPQVLMTVQSNDLPGAAVRRYLFPEPFVFDQQGYPHWDRSTLCVLSTSETYLAFFQAIVQSPVHPGFGLAPGSDCTGTGGPGFPVFAPFSA